MTIHFSRPICFSLLPIAFIWLYWCWCQQRQQGWSTLLPKAISKRLVHGQDNLKQSIPWITALWLLIIIIALAGPNLRSKAITAVSGGNARVLVMDMSMSMRATDAIPDRLHIARFKALDLLKNWRGG